MKALHVFYRIFHYLTIWFFILAGLVLAYSVLLLKVDNVKNAQGFASIALVLAILAIVFFAAAHIFRMSKKLVARKHEQNACCCCCKEHECAPESDLDEQVEEIMKWKNLYVEGIITEREFIDKRNEILRLSK